MTLTLLLDLDDTLLINDMDAFLPRYLESFSRHVADYIQPDLFVQNLLLGTHAMVTNRRPDCTLQEVFNQAFFAQVQVDEEKFTQLANKFYEEIFPSLQKITSPAPGAVKIVKQAFERGYQLAVATNPLFPISAIRQRLAWAGLKMEDYPFQVVTSYEKYHFAKPAPAYYAELMAQLGWPDGPVVMVGDDLERDIIPASRLGLATYYVGSKDLGASDNQPFPTATGTLENLVTWLDRTPFKDLTPSYTTPESILAILRSTPAVLNSLCRDLPADAWLRQPGPTEWRLTEVLCHLRDVEIEVNLFRVDTVLSESNPFIAGKDTDKWAVERGYRDENGEFALEQFTAARLKVLQRLENLNQKEWDLPARHAIFGPTRLVELASIAAAHDRLHVQQVLNLLSIFQP